MNQAKSIKDHLSRVGHITPLEALNLYGCFRLAARIDELRRQGLPIVTETQRSAGKHWAKYVLQQGQQRLFL